jgi:hypothetical protein
MTEPMQQQPGGNGEEQPSPAELLGEMRALRKQTSSIRRAYWLPLLLFGVLIAGSLPLYQLAVHHGTLVSGPLHPIPMLGVGYFSIYVGGEWIGLYWFLAIQTGIAATVWWYRWRGLRSGLRTPTRALLVSGLVVTEVALLVSVFVRWPGFAFGALFGRGFVPLLILVVPLAVLAWLERSPILAVITAAYAGLALLACLYNVENILFRLGWHPSWRGGGLNLVTLPNVALPALFLLLAGAGAWLAARLNVGDHVARSREPV